MNLEILFLKKKKQKIKKRVHRLYENAVNLYNHCYPTIFNDYNTITDEEKEEMDKKCNPRYLFLKAITMINGTKN